MNFVKRPLGILLALAIVFTTIVCVSVGASVDFPIHNSVVSYSEGYTQNCKQAKPEYAGNNKIAYFSVQDVGSTNALAKAMAANLKTFVNNSEITGDYISIDFYAEFTTSADNARVAASLDFGAGKVLPQPKNTNVAKPTENQSFDFVNGKMVTMKLLKEEVLTSVIADEDSLDSVAITLFPQRNEKVTGTFFFSVPYFAVDDGDNVSTVNLTSIKTTTTKADEQYTGQIAVYPDGATFVGKHADAKVSVPGTGTNRATAFYGDIAGYEKKYLHFDGDGQQLQIIETQISGLAELRERAIATDKLICIDIYANEFTNGGVKNAMCDLQLLFNGGKQIGTDNDRKTIRSNIKQTVSFLPTMVGASSTKLNITLQNYSYGDQKNITNGKFIITAPYVEGDKPSEVFEPVTTTTTTTFVPPVQAYDGSVAIYDNGVTYSAKDSWNGTNKMFLGDFTSENFDATNKYVHIDSIGTPQQIQGKLNLQNMSSIVNKATKEKKTVFIDIYANNFKNGGHSGKADFMVTFSGGSATGARDCTISAGKRNTLAIAPSKVGNGGYFSFTIQNYSYGDYKTIIDAKFILSVPYTVDDIEGATLVTPSTTTTTTQSTTTTTLGQPDYGTIKTDADGNPVTDENGNPVYEKLPLKIKDTPVVYDANGSWGNPDGAFYLSSDKKSANVFSANPYQNFQFYVQAKNLPQLIVDAAAKNANVAIDFYGNFLEKGKTKENSQAKAKVSFGKSIFYGANPNNADGGDQWKMKYFKTDTVMRFEINARDYLNRVKAKGTTTKADTSRKESESLTKTGTAAYTQYTQTDISPTNAKLDQFNNTAVGDYIEYQVTGVKAGTYDISMFTRDYNQRGSFEVYVNGKLLNSGINFISNTKSYNEHKVGTYTLTSDGNLDIKLVCTKKSAGSVSLALDSFYIKDVNEAPTSATQELSDADLAKDLKVVQVQIYGNDYNSKTLYGRFYMSVPYIVGAEEVGEGIDNVTTTTTRPIPTSTGKPFGSIEDVDFGYVDCKVNKIEWPAGGSTAARNDGGKTLTIGVSGDQSQQIGASIEFNAGTSLRKFPEYIQYAKDAGAMIAIDVYPTFSMSNGSKAWCYMNATWVGSSGSLTWPTNIKAFKLNSGEKFTYVVSPEDLPADATLFRPMFDTYEYNPGWRAMLKGASFVVTAPYLVDVKNVDNTTTTTTTTTSTTTTRSTGPRYPFPSNNVGGSTRFRIGNVDAFPGASVKVPVVLEKNEGLFSAKFSVKFNSEDLLYTGMSIGTVFNSVDATNVDDANYDGIIDVLAQSSADTYKTGVVCYLHFDVSTIEDYYELAFGGSGFLPSNFFNYDGKNVPCSFRSGYVVVNSPGGTVTAPEDPDAFKSYPSYSTGSTRFTISSVSENYVAGTQYKDYSINISISGNAGISRAKFTVSYDNTKLQFLGSTPAKSIPPVFNLVDYNLDAVEYEPGVITYNIDAKDGRTATNSTINGNIVTLKFRLSKYAVGTYNIAFGGESYDAKGFANAAGKTVPCAFTSGGIDIKAPAVAKTTIKSIKLTAKKTAKITWKKSANAAQYQVFRAKGSSKSFTKIATVKTTSYTNKSLKAGTKYTYKVVAINGNVKSAASSTKSITTMNYKVKPVIKKVKPASKKLTITLKKKVVGATGYQIQYAKNSKFSSAKAVTSKKLTKAISKLSSKTTYYVRVRAYNTVNGKKAYGSWSKVSKGTAK